MSGEGLGVMEELRVWEEVNGRKKYKIMFGVPSGLEEGGGGSWVGGVGGRALVGGAVAIGAGGGGGCWERGEAERGRVLGVERAPGG